jgi:hypothetical protein
MFFHLWSDGGPNWRREFEQWQLDSSQEWTLVSPSKRRSKLGMDALNLPTPKPSLKHTATINKRLGFAEEIHYEARKGYAAGNSHPVELHLYNTVSSPVGTSTTLHFHTEKQSGEAPPNNIQEEKQTVEESTLIHNLNSFDNSKSGKEDEVEEDNQFDQMVDDMVFQFWKCQHCLSMSHITKDCVNKVRCRGCFNYGHIKRNFLTAKASLGKCWVPKLEKKGTWARTRFLLLGRQKGLSVRLPRQERTH